MYPLLGTSIIKNARIARATSRLFEGYAGRIAVL